ncbi:hypothetical protein F5880DRAFT_1512907 [Lentinula raphanica]|nr:hypothetical protein F5880DRAFT_1512907 [Lentinula raphanica]
MGMLACLSPSKDLSWMTSFVCSTRAQFTSAAAELLLGLHWNSWKDKRLRGANVLARFLIEFPAIVKVAFLLFAGVILALKLKIIADRLILEVSHRYLAFEFRRMLRHDAERGVVM